MDKFKGTPSPWRVDDQDPTFYGVASDTYHQIKAGAGYLVEGENKGFGLSGIMSIHDANLIAAAPALLEALQEMVEIVKKNSYPQPDKPSSNYARAEAAQAVIAKALGK